jgi:hypothetical protein
MTTVEPLELTPLRERERLSGAEIVNTKLAVVEPTLLGVLNQRFDFLIRQYRFVVGLFSHSIPYCVMYAVK